ncbi:MAG TPA: TadE/TadG family type IV pilus assembly protein, partial [Xanthobacteraceae bacterium]|nr:TadE/TadG family type IV pilus assembly protein [Xanthobacteraceae bacterium]
MTTALRARMLRPARGLLAFCRDPRGAAVVEFAILLPLMLTLYIAGTEISNAIAIDRKVTITARTVTDLASRATSISTQDMSDILAASAAVIAPYLPANMTFTVSQIYIDNNGNATISGWSCSYQGSPHTLGQSVTLPNQLITNNSYLIWGQAQYNYTPPIGYVITGTLILKDQIYMVPRMSSSVTGPA